MLELSANISVSAYFDVGESDSDVYFTKFFDPRVSESEEVKKSLKNSESKQM